MTPRVIDRRGDDGNDDGVGVGDSVLVARCLHCSAPLGSAPRSHALADAKLPLQAKRLARDLLTLPAKHRAIILEALGVTGYLGSVTNFSDALFTCRRCGAVTHVSGPEGRVTAKRHLESVEDDED